MNRTLFILFLFSQLVSKAQNLVHNPSFEDTLYCPQESSTSFNMALENAIGWTFPTSEGTSDYFNSCSPTSNVWTSVSTPLNFVGFQEAQTGVAYSGMYMYYFNPDSGIDYGTEYIQSQLSEPLVGGVEYYLSFSVNAANFSEFNIDEIGAYVSASAIGSTGYKTLNVTPQVKSAPGFYITDTLNWTLISGSFIAVGGEQFITIGNFNDSISTDTLSTGVLYPTGENGAYYYVDDVCISSNSETCLISLGIDEIFSSNKKELCKIIDLTGRETKDISNALLIYIYSDGTTKKVFRYDN